VENISRIVSSTSLSFYTRFRLGDWRIQGTVSPTSYATQCPTAAEELTLCLPAAFPAFHFLQHIYPAHPLFLAAPASACQVDWGCERSQGADTGAAIAQALGLNYLFLCEFEELHSPLRDPHSQGGGVHGNAILSK
jgi:hypothetical protein